MEWLTIAGMSTGQLRIPLGRVICNIYRMVGRSIANPTRGAKRRGANMPPRSDIEAMDQPTVLYMIYRMVSAQQTNLFALDSRTFRRDAIFHLEVDMTYNEPRHNT